MAGGEGFPSPADVLPHDGIALVLDEVTEYEPGLHVVGLWTPDERYFEGHFPGEPILPGHWTTESVAQAGAYALLAEGAQILPLFRENHGQFSNPVRPGDTVEVEATFDEIKPGSKMSTATGHGRATVGGKKVYTAKLLKAVWSPEADE